MNTNTTQNIGKITQIIGPVIDVAFENNLPDIRNALTVKSADGSRDIVLGTGSQNLPLMVVFSLCPFLQQALEILRCI